MKHSDSIVSPLEHGGQLGILHTKQHIILIRHSDPIGSSLEH